MFLFAAAFSAPFWPLLESITLQSVRNQAVLYARFRTWGSVGFVAGLALVSLYFTYAPYQHLPIAIALLITPAIWFSFTIYTKQHLKKTTAIPIRQLLAKKEVLLFFAACTLAQAAHATYYVFFSIHVIDQGHNTLIAGGLWILGIVAEIVLFARIGSFYSRFPIYGMLLAVFILSALRWGILAMVSLSLIGFLLVQLLHAITYGLSHSVSMHLLGEYFGTKSQTQGQALYASIVYGIGGGTGTILSGYWWQWGGALYAFSFAAVLALCSTVLAIILWRYTLCSRQ